MTSPDGTYEWCEAAAGSAGGYLVGVVGGGAAPLDAVRGHHGSQVVSLHQQLVQVPAALLVNVDDGSGHLGDALDHHLRAAKVEVVKVTIHLMIVTR